MAFWVKLRNLPQLAPALPITVRAYMDGGLCARVVGVVCTRVWVHTHARVCACVLGVSAGHPQGQNQLIGASFAAEPGTAVCFLSP